MYIFDQASATHIYFLLTGGRTKARERIGAIGTQRSRSGATAAATIFSATAAAGAEERWGVAALVRTRGRFEKESSAAAGLLWPTDETGT